MTPRIDAIRGAVQDAGLTGWLLFDFHGTNPIARRILGVGRSPSAPKTTRRWFYWIPAEGEPRKLVHRLEPSALDHLPGAAAVYLTWQELGRALAELLQDAGGAPSRIAMEYSPEARLPYVSRVDAGTIELVRSAGVTVVSSADLAQRFEGALDADARSSHRRAGALLHRILGAAFQHVRERAWSSEPATEMELQRWIFERLARADLTSSEPPAVAVNRHSGDPHFMNAPAIDAPIRAGDFLLIDAWAKERAPGSVYADYTQVAFLGETAPDRHRTVFEAVREARDAAIEYVRRSLREGRAPRGCDVDDAARGVLREQGFAERFVHRTGHSIGEEVHGNGVHLDNLETRDERTLIEGSLVSVEPGVYLEEFGVRSEVNLLVDGGEAVVTTEPIQREILCLAR